MRENRVGTRPRNDRVRFLIVSLRCFTVVDAFAHDVTRSSVKREKKRVHEIREDGAALWRRRRLSRGRERGCQIVLRVRGAERLCIVGG